jgi:hypothetical protein
MRQVGIIVAAFAAASIFPLSWVQAQEVYMFQGYLQGYLRTDLNNRLIQQAAEQKTETRPRNGPRFLGPPIGKPPDLNVLRFTPDLALRKTIAGEYVKTVADGQSSTPLGRFLIDGALSGMHRRMVAAGLSPSNVAHNFAFFIASHWSMARGNTILPPRPALIAFSKQVAGMLAEQPAAPRMTNAAKQRQADSAMLLNAIMLRAMEEARGDPEASSGIAASASQMLKGMGFDPARFNLTAQGLVAVK